MCWALLASLAVLECTCAAEDVIAATHATVDRIIGTSWGQRVIESPGLGSDRSVIERTSAWENLTSRIDPSDRLPSTQRAVYAQPLASPSPPLDRVGEDDAVNEAAKNYRHLSTVGDGDVADSTSDQTHRSSQRLTPRPDEITQRYDASALAHLPAGDSSACLGANPIDLPTTLRLAGASNLQVAIARERVCEANANHKMANAMWLPSLNFGVGYNNHNGRIQATEGRVIEAARSSLFVGGGVAISGLPIAGGSGGPLRFGVDLSLSDALYEPLAAYQRVQATTAAHSSTFNDVLMEAAVSYLELVRGQAQRSIAMESIKNAQELVRLTVAQQAADVGLPADVQRARAELAFREQQQLSADEQIGVASARLARILHLDACCKLCTSDDRPVTISLIDPSTPLCDLITQAIAARPERCEALAVLDETTLRKEQEHYRPWLPNIHLGYSAGGFGGSDSSSIDRFGSRGDLDMLAVWQVRNMGIGTHALREQARSRYRQASLAEANVRDHIGAEVSAAHYQVQSRLAQIDVTRRNVEAAAQALPLNFRGILGRQLRAIEAQQAIHALDNAWRQHLDAIILYNQSQFQLLRAVGKPANADQMVLTPVTEMEE